MLFIMRVKVRSPEIIRGYHNGMSKGAKQEAKSLTAGISGHVNNCLTAHQSIDDGCQHAILKACRNLLPFPIQDAYIDGRKGPITMLGCATKVGALTFSHDLIVGIHASSRICHVMRLAGHDCYNATLLIDDGPRVTKERPDEHLKATSNTCSLLSFPWHFRKPQGKELFDCIFPVRVRLLEVEGRVGTLGRWESLHYKASVDGLSHLLNHLCSALGWAMTFGCKFSCPHLAPLAMMPRHRGAFVTGGCLRAIICWLYRAHTLGGAC